jgi:PHD/YefM family antitoxin component YafN of YafNO toxin-antitoxin module
MSFRFSDLSRRSKAVAQAADKAPVTITRRGGDDLLLIRKADVDIDREGLTIATQITAAAAAVDGLAAFIERLHIIYPWIEFLSASEKQECAKELVNSASACASMMRFDPLVGAVAGWRSTAEAYAAGWVEDRYTWLDSTIQVDRPTAGADGV